MNIATETFRVTEGTTMLEGKPVKPGDLIEMTPRQALYHVGLGRLELTVKIIKTAAVGKSTDALRVPDPDHAGADDSPRHANSKDQNDLAPNARRSRRTTRKPAGGSSD